MIINLTPHTITEVTTGISYEPSGIVCRMDTATELDYSIDGLPVYKTKYGKLQGLPEPQENVWYIVSGLCLNSPEIVGRKDVLAPGNLVRNENGQPVGCRGFRTA